MFRTAGFATQTPLQKRLIPLILSARDVSVTADRGSGATAGYLLTLMSMFRSEPGALPSYGEGVSQSPRAVILVSDAEDAKEVAREAARFSRVIHGAPTVATIGESEDARREERLLERAPVVLVGTAGRVIDHIRRGELPLEKVSLVVVEMPSPDLAEDFVKDVQFIFAKIPVHRQTVLIARSAGQDAALAGFLRRPVALSSGKPMTHEHLFFRVERGDKAGLLTQIFLSKGLEEAVVVHSPRVDGAALARQLSACGIEALAVAAGSSPAVRKKAFSAFARGELDALVLPYPPSADLDASHARFIVYYDLPPVRSAAAGREGQPFTRFSGGLIAFMEGSQDRELEKIQEAHGVTMKNENRPENAEVIRGSLDRIMRKVREEENLDELAAMRAIVRRHVPLLMRSYILAYLFKSSLPAMTEELQARPGQESKRQRPEQKPAGRTPQQPQPRYQGRGKQGTGPRLQGIPSEKPQTAQQGGFIQLFVSIGRNRRVYPRDLSSFFMEKLQLRSEEIGNVRVFDKYSFVEISAGRAGEAINRLSGSDFKGKAITVNFAKKKEEKGGS